MKKAEQKPEEQKEISIDQVANDIYAVLRGIKLMSNGMGLNADEHDGLKQRLALLHTKAKEADAYKKQCQDHETTIKSLQAKKK